MRKSDFELALVVNNRDIDEYSHEGNVFVEGRRGSEFSIRFKNHSAKRVLVIPSVDGVSPIDGKEANTESMGFVVKPLDEINIPGWIINEGDAAKFIFKDKSGSYVSSTSNSNNAGVVGVLVYGEVEKRSVSDPTLSRPIPVPTFPIVPIPVYPTYPPVGWPGLDNGLWKDGPYPNGNGITYSSTTGEFRGFGVTHTVNSVSASCASVKTPNSEETTFDLGTGWGEKTEFKVNETQFDKGELKTQMVVYYDSLRGLEKRGIVVKPLRQTEQLPSAFSSIGCTPPPGWKG